jgi:hypothetical protein
MIRILKFICSGSGIRGFEAFSLCYSLAAREFLGRVIGLENRVDTGLANGAV